VHSMVPRARRMLPATLAAAAAAVLLATCSAGAGGSAPSPAAIPSAGAPALRVKPPTATPLASAPAAPAGDGTTITLHTEKGDIVIALDNRSAPVAAQNFENLARAGFYDGTVFHRIVPGFVIQGGDPTGTGTGGPGYSSPDEPFAGTYVPGTVAMANSGPNTNGSQFFVVIGAQAVSLPYAYTIFGTVTSGLDVAVQGHVPYRGVTAQVADNENGHRVILASLE